MTLQIDKFNNAILIFTWDHLLYIPLIFAQGVVTSMCSLHGTKGTYSILVQQLYFKSIVHSNGFLY